LIRRLALVALAASLAASCGRGPSPARKKERLYPLRGVITEVHPERREIVVRHQDIPGYMKAMTMPFPVGDDPALLRELAPGDKITGMLRVGPARYQLEQISVIGSESSGPASRVDPSKVIGRGAIFPDFTLRDQDGQTVALSQFHGRSVVLSFVYTRCPVSWACPATLAKLAQAASLAEGAGVRDFHILLITMDPAHDTPPVLRTYSHQVDMSKGRWSFLTGRPEAIGAVAEHLGIFYFRERGEITHSLAAAVLGPDRQLVARHEGRDWTPEQIAHDIEAAARPAA